MVVTFPSWTLDQLLAMELPPSAPEPDHRPTWTELTEAEPGLLNIEHRALALHQSYDAAWPDWRAWSEQVKQPMMKLVGWEAEKYELRTSAAYDVAYDHLLDCWENGR